MSRLLMILICSVNIAEFVGNEQGLAEAGPVGGIVAQVRKRPLQLEAPGLALEYRLVRQANARGPIPVGICQQALGQGLGMSDQHGLLIKYKA